MSLSTVTEAYHLNLCLLYIVTSAAVVQAYSLEGESRGYLHAS